MRGSTSLKAMSTIVLAVLLTSVLSIGGAAAVQGLADEYPELKPLIEFVGEDNLSVLHLVGFRAAVKAMSELGFEKGSPNILALTDAGYIAKIGEYTTEKALDGVMITSGLSRGKGNLVNIHKPYNSPLWFAFFSKETKECLYLEANGELLKSYLDRERVDRSSALSEFMKLRDEEVFSRIAKENIDAEKLLNNPEAWHEKMVAKVFGGNEFSLITICNVWAYKGIPNDFLKAVELHDHICPGLTSGYLIAKYVEKNFPAKAPRYEYTVIACPPWCKDDAIIQYFETNVGHKRMFVKWLTSEQKRELKKYLPEELKPWDTANIFIRWERGASKGEGILLGFNWSKASKECGVKRSWFRDFKTWRWWWTRLKMDLWIADYVDKPEELVTIIKKFEVDSPSLIERLKSAGVNPLVELGLMLEKPPLKSVMHAAAYRATMEAFKRLPFTLKDEVLAMLPAPTVKAGELLAETSPCIDVIRAMVGYPTGQCTVLPVHRSYDSPLWFAFYKKSTGELLYLKVNMDLLAKYLAKTEGRPTEEFASLGADKIFTEIVKVNIDLSRLDDKGWTEVSEKLGGDAFSLVGIANVWAAGKGRLLLASAAMLHNHVCPGLTGGYLLSQYIIRNVPLAEGEKYIFISVPIWCKDDAFQIIFDTTVGKRGLFARQIPKDVQKKLPEEVRNIATILVKWDQKAGKGRGYALFFDWVKAKKKFEAEAAPIPKSKGLMKLKMALWMLNYEDKPEEFISTVKEFNVDSQLLSKLQCAGVNPLVELGLTSYQELGEAGMPMPAELKPGLIRTVTVTETITPPPGKAKPAVIEVVPLWAYVVMAVLAIIAAVMGSLYARARAKTPKL